MKKRSLESGDSNMARDGIPRMNVMTESTAISRAQRHHRGST